MSEHHFDSKEDAGSDEEVWRVRVAEQDVRTMTFEQLKEAFVSGVISDETFVQDDESAEWRTLRQIAGRETSAQTDNARDIEDAGDLDFELKLVDFRPRRRAHLAIAAGAAIAIIVAAVVGLTRPPLSLPTPWLDAPKGSAKAAAGAVNDIAPTTLQETTRANMVRP